MTTTLADPPLADRRIPAGGDWLSPQALAELTPEVLLERTRALAPRAAAAAAEAEGLRRPVDDVWNALRASGYFYMYVPRRFGGLEVTTDQFIDITLPLAQACPSTAWAAAFCAEHNWFLSHFPEETQQALFGDAFPYIVAPVVSTPIGKAVPVDGGYRLTGRWKWGTGVMHADWIMASALVVAEGGAPDVLTFLFPAADAAVLDTWRVSGMVATGSNDIAVDDLFVPKARAIPLASLLNGRGPGSRRYDNPLYSMPMLPFLAMTAAIPALGAARLALADYRERLAGHVRMGAAARQADRPAAQIRLGKADAMIAAAEQLIRQAGRDNVASGALDGEAQLRARVSNRARIAYGVALCREAVACLAEAAGSSAQMLDQPFQRAVRDLNVIATHVVFDVDTAFELNGRALVGLPPNATLV
ncbi:MAG: acyl-CoA dehydrogenase [Proteobacteria bacterium]|nr:acyl-CoA dehydrogenase [Pseudomonadota bacterium]